MDGAEGSGTIEQSSLVQSSPRGLGCNEAWHLVIKNNDVFPMIDSPDFTFKASTQALEELLT